MSLPVTEDTPPDMLAGSMDLNVVLPNGKNVKMSIQRSTPMMDLLVQVTTAHRLSPGNYSIQAVGDRGVLPYKPSTPIGILDAFTIKIVDKKGNIHKKAPQVPQSFLNTFRLQVNLPRSQLFVARVTPDITLAEILTHVCTEKSLDINKYEFRIPGNPDEPLELSRTLGSYKVQELSLVNKYNRAVGGLLSSADILHVKSSKHRQSSMCDSSLSSGSLGSRSTSPVPVNLARVPPQPPIRKKRRPAPKPPQLNENESKEEMKTSRQALISHSRESSDSSGYHEASVLSESPTHGVPLRQSEMSNQPDTLPRQSKLPSSQSFTNLVTIQPGARMRLVNSVSNASLNSNGVSRKKRAAPPPPTTYPAVEERMKSSTLPTSRAEERIISNVPFVPAENSDKVDLVEEANTKVEIVENSVESESNLIIETKVEVGTSKSDAKSGLEIAEKPVPKPRTLLDGNCREEKVSISRRHTDSGTLSSVDGSEKNSCDEDNFEVRGDISSSENMKIVKSAPKMGLEDDCNFARLERWRNIDTLACLTEDETKATKTAWLMGDSEASGDVSSVEEAEHDSLNWQYQLPPPPTDFRDTHSPSFTDVGAVTLTPDIYKEEADKESDMTDSQTNELKDCVNMEEKGENEDKDGLRFLQKKTNVMCELTNVLMDNWKTKEKSSSVTNLYVNDNKKVSSLSYSKSFTSEIPMKNFKISTYDTFGAENEKYDNEIKYKNYKNLEKSLSMECIQMRGREEPENKTEDPLRKFIAPVQKKMKVAKRSSSTMGYNKPEQRKSESDLDFDVDADNIAVLRQHFLDFLKEKKLTNDLNMKSLTVMRHILPQINGQGCQNNNNNNNNNERKESRPNATSGSVKVVDFKRKANTLFDNEIKENVVIIEKDMKKDAEMKREQESKKAEPVKRYSYHAPPSINFATWGERPKTQVFIKDEDYVTEEKVTKKLEKKPVEEIPKPAILKKPSTLQFKKPGVKSHYEMFSALPKKKEVTSLTLIQMEDEEKRRKQMEAKEAKEPSRVPVVCGVELKKEFREQASGVNKSISVTEVKIQPEVKPSHSVSIYINSDQKKEAVTKSNMASSKPSVSNFSIQRKTPLMPVVKGFRTFSPVQNRFTHNEFCNGGINKHSSNLSSSSSSSSNSASNRNINNNMSYKYSNNGVSIINESNVIKRQKSPSEVSSSCFSGPPPPPPPPFVANLKPASERQLKPKTTSVNARDQLMEDIRNFKGFKTKN